MSATKAMRTLIGQLAENGGDQELVHDMIETLTEIEREYVELPKGGDNETIRPGDRLTHTYEDGDACPMDCLMLHPGGTWRVALFVDGGDRMYPVEACRHVKLDSWERLFDDIKRQVDDPDTIDEWRERAIKLAGDA